MKKYYHEGDGLLREVPDVNVTPDLDRQDQFIEFYTNLINQYEKKINDMTFTIGVLLTVILVLGVCLVVTALNSI